MLGKLLGKKEDEGSLPFWQKEGESEPLVKEEVKQSVLRGVANSIRDRATEAGGQMRNKLDEGKSIKWAVILFLAAIACFGFSVLFLPVIVLSPHKFAFLFSCGSFLSLAAMGCYHGPGSYIKKLFSAEKALFTIAYLVSVLATLWASVIMDSYLLTLICCLGQLFACLWFVCVGFPGGLDGMKFFTKAIGNGIVSCFTGMFRR